MCSQRYEVRKQLSPACRTVFCYAGTGLPPRSARERDRRGGVRMAVPGYAPPASRLVPSAVSLWRGDMHLRVQMQMYVHGRACALMLTRAYKCSLCMKPHRWRSASKRRASDSQSRGWTSSSVPQKMACMTASAAGIRAHMCWTFTYWHQSMHACMHARHIACLRMVAA